MPKTKIIATLGPASGTPNIIRKMMAAGLDVVRLNFSHGKREDKLCLIETVRELNRKYRRHIRILGDLEGYRIRIGDLQKPMEIAPRETIYLAPENVHCRKRCVPFDYKGSLADILDGREVYIDDGNLALLVTHHVDNMLETRVTMGGLLKQHKGVNIPSARLRFHGLTEKDRADIAFCVEHKVDFLAQSFVRNADDMRCVREAMGDAPIRLIAKIENRQGVHNLKEIMEVCDGIMIARGDLGVSLPIFEVPLIQKEMIRKCCAAGKFSITATQMLESMIANPRHYWSNPILVASSSFLKNSEEMSLTCFAKINTWFIENKNRGLSCQYLHEIYETAFLLTQFEDQGIRINVYLKLIKESLRRRHETSRSVSFDPPWNPGRCQAVSQKPGRLSGKHGPY